MELARPESVSDAVAVARERRPSRSRGGTELIPLLRDRIVAAETLVELRRAVPRGVDGTTIGAGTTLGELEVDPQIPDALREACRLAASPQLRAAGTIGGNLLQATRCWYWRLKFPCRLHGGDRCHAREGEHREHAIFANDFCASAHPSDPAAALLALGATRAHRPARAAARGAVPAADRGRPLDDDARARRADRRARRSTSGRVRLPEGDGPAALVVRARRSRGRALRRRDERSASPASRRSRGPTLDGATPLPGTAYKTAILDALVKRARQAVAA